MPPIHNFSEIQSCLTREVWIITAAQGQQRGGLTATWVTPATLDPQQPILLAALAVNHFTTELVRGSRAFAAHLLRADQTNVAWDFARDCGRDRDKFANYDLLPASPNVRSPILKDCLAWLDCRVTAIQSAGERWLVWGDVVALEKNDSEHPLTDKAFIAGLSNEQKSHLAARRSADIIDQTPLHQQWRLESLLKLG